MRIITRAMLAAASFVVIALLASSAIAQTDSGQVVRSIQTTGEATVTAVPDRAEIDIGVTTTARSSQAAAEQNAQKLNATLTALRNLLGSNADIRTFEYAITPQYRYPTNGGERELTGYEVRNSVRVTLDDLSKVGAVIDTAVAAGSNRIDRLRFTLRDETTSQQRALREATVQAKAKAAAIASAAGVTLGDVISVTEGGSPITPYREVSLATADRGATPIESGQIEIRASVTVRIKIND